MPDVTVTEYAARHGVSPQTVKRRLKSGALVGYRVDTAQGFTWHINDMTNDIPVNGDQGGELLEFLREQLGIPQAGASANGIVNGRITTDRHGTACVAS